MTAFVVCRLLQPLEQPLPGRRHYVSGLKCLARRIHSTTRSKPFSKIKVDTDFRTAGTLTQFMVALPQVKMIKDTRKKGEGEVIKASSSGQNTRAFFSVCISFAQVGYAFSEATKIKIKGKLPARPFIVPV